MEINISGYTTRDLISNRANFEQDMTQKALEKNETARKDAEPLESRPVEQASVDKQGRIDIYV